MLESRKASVATTWPEMASVNGRRKSERILKMRYDESLSLCWEIGDQQRRLIFVIF